MGVSSSVLDVAGRSGRPREDLAGATSVLSNDGDLLELRGLMIGVILLPSN